MTWFDPDRFISFTLARVPLDELDGLVAGVLAGFRTEALRRRSAPLALASIYDVAPPSGGAHPHKLVLFAPRAAIGFTMIVTNSIDGWSSLSHVAASRHQRFQIQLISTGAQSQFPQNRFTSWDKGVETRSVICMLDTGGWVFYERGEVQLFENITNYNKRRRADRLTRDILVSYLGNLRVDVTSRDFWSSDQDAVYYLPYH